MKLLDIELIILYDYFRLIPRTQEMTQLLLSRGIMSRGQLLETWEADKNCKYMFYSMNIYRIGVNTKNDSLLISVLLSAYQKWLPESAHGYVMLIWPPV